MPDSVQLPFCVPWIAYTQGHAAPGIAMAGHPTAYNGYLNQIVAIECGKAFLGGLTTPQISIPNANLKDFEYLEKHIFCSKYGHPYYKDVIKRMLDDGFYVYFTDVDDFFVPGKCWYGIRHMWHDGIICGYDENDETYSIASHNTNWVFSLFRVPQKCFMEGMMYCVDKKEFGTITAYRVKQGAVVELDEKLILRNMKLYISHTIETCPIDQPGGAEGFAVQDYLAMYLDKLKDGSIPSDKLDWRALRPVWEHKRCMFDRIRAVEDKFGWDHILSEMYRPLVDNINRVRMMYAMYHINRNVSLLDKMKVGILDVKGKEYTILHNLIDRMEAEVK